MDKFVVLKQSAERGKWDHLGATEAESAAKAIEQLAASAGGGVCVAVPFEVWVMFEVQATVSVTPLRRAGRVEDEPAELDPDREVLLESGLSEEDVDDIDGLTQPGGKLNG